MTKGDSSSSASSLVDVEHQQGASRRLSCLEASTTATTVQLTTFSFEYWIAVGSTTGSLSTHVLPMLDAYIVGQVEQKIEWCNQVDLMHLLSSGSGPAAGEQSKEAVGSLTATRNQSSMDSFESGQHHRGSDNIESSGQHHYGSDESIESGQHHHGSRDLSVVSFVHSGLEYPSNCEYILSYGACSHGSVDSGAS